MKGFKKKGKSGFHNHQLRLTGGMGWRYLQDLGDAFLSQVKGSQRGGKESGNEGGSPLSVEKLLLGLSGRIVNR